MAEPATSNGMLRRYIERVERLEEEKRALAADIAVIYAEAKANGFEPKIMRKLVTERRKNAAQREEEEALLEIYRRALGPLKDTPLGDAAMKAAKNGRAAPRAAGKAPVQAPSSPAPESGPRPVANPDSPDPAPMRAAFDKAAAASGYEKQPDGSWSKDEPGASVSVKFDNDPPVIPRRLALPPDPNDLTPSPFLDRRAPHQIDLEEVAGR